MNSTLIRAINDMFDTARKEVATMPPAYPPLPQSAEIDALLAEYNAAEEIQNKVRESLRLLGLVCDEAFRVSKLGWSPDFICEFYRVQHAIYKDKQQAIENLRLETLVRLSAKDTGDALVAALNVAREALAGIVKGGRE